MKENIGNGMSQISVTIQVGLISKKINLDIENISLIGLKRIICANVEEKFPEHGILRLFDRLLIFRHDYSSANILQVRLLFKLIGLMLMLPRILIE